MQGDRFGGALDEAAKMFGNAYDSGQTPMDFVNETKKKGQTIMGIGHRVKSVLVIVMLLIDEFPILNWL